MMYNGLKTNEGLRFIKCPVCGNNEFSSEAGFCKICGSALYNFCQDHYDENGYRVSNGCGRPNPGNARFCEYCGNPTLLFKYLNHWEEENKAIIETKLVVESHEQTALTDSDDLSHAFDEFLEDDAKEESGFTS